MKSSILLIITLLFTSVVSAQTKSKPSQKPVSQIDQAVFRENQKTSMDNFRSRVKTKLQQIQSANSQTSAELKTSLSSTISSYIDNTLLKRTIDRTRLPDPNKPYMTEVYCPDPKGIKPFGEFLLIGANLVSSTGTSNVTIKFGQTSVSCTPLYGKSTGERLWVFANDFSGISGSTAATVSVTNDKGTSPPAGITLFPELVTKELDLTKFLSQLQSDNRFTNPTVYSTSISAAKHEYLVFYNVQLAVYHDCPYIDNRTTEYRGTDEFFINTSLKNNWVVKDYVYWDNRSVCGTVPDGQTTSFFAPDGWNTPNLYLKMGWYNNIELCFQSSYVVTYIIEGPKGTNYW